MQYSEVSSRYAKALFDLATAAKLEERIFNELRKFSEIIHASSEINAFVHSKLIRPNQKQKVIEEAVKGKGFSPLMEEFLGLLASSGRIEIFEEMEWAFQDLIDQANGVTRGEVKSSKALSPEERKLIETRVAQALGKSVILQYKEDPSIIGGLIAEAGGFCFDDSLTTHLRRLKEVMNRSTH